MPPTDEPWGVREFHLRHPDGHTFRVGANRVGGHSPTLAHSGDRTLDSLTNRRSAARDNVSKREVARLDEHAQHGRHLSAGQPFVAPLAPKPLPGHRVDGTVSPGRLVARVRSEHAEHIEASLPRRAAEVHARREDTL